ncbi:MAG: protein-glutamate O-methyltransferase CheR [Candidatus Heimdallarchaeota archaeon]|nr:protein-glutamate O-methyltransferase CheR [Candidatus Heimdallarchaeota archaeon]
MEGNDHSNPFVARGATLYNKKKDKSKSEDKLPNHKPKTFQTNILPVYQEAPDIHNEDKLIHFLQANGIETNSYKKKYIIRRLRVRMGRLQINSYQDYLDYLKNTPKEIAEIQESLSINVTRFFRNRDSFEKIKSTVYPDLFNSNKEVRIWSAGCAVGAEPYSLAMLAHDTMPSNVRVSITASDVKDELLQIARYGVYTDSYLAELKDHEISRYFNHSNLDEYRIKPEIKRMVNFIQHDLMKDEYPGKYDLIVCRNVLIYVDRDAQFEIINKFFNALKAGGYLILGRTETLFGNWKSTVNIISTKHRIYQKISDEQYKPIDLESVSENRSRFSDTDRTRRSSKYDGLTDFSKTFQERKKIWEDMLEDHKKKRLELEENSKYLARKTGIKTFSRRSSTTQIKRRLLQEKSINEKENNNEREKPLTKYRNMLKNTGEPIKISQTRKDLEIEDIRLMRQTKLPEDSYKILKDINLKRKERKRL